MASLLVQPLYIIAGLLLGYVTVSVAESFLHRNVQHANRRFRSICRRIGSVGGIIHRAHLSHTVVHHGRTFKGSHVQQFRSPEEQLELDQWLAAKTASQRIRRERYGLSLAGAGIIWFTAPVVPLFTLYVLFLPLSMALSSLTLLVLYPCSSMFLHPYLHMSREEAMRTASRPMRWFLGTSYVQFISRHHYMHHRYIHCNYNLLWLGDYLLGHHRRPSEEDLALMRELSMFC